MFDRKWCGASAIAMIVAGVGCSGAPTNPKELTAAYQDAWRAIPQADDILERELFQLAFPTETSVAVWHLYDNRRESSHNKEEQRECTPLEQFSIRLKGGKQVLLDVPKTRRNLRNETTNKCEWVANTPKAERIDFDGLTPNTEYEILLADQVILQAKTKPRETPDKLSFLAFSCNNPYAVRTESVRGENVEFEETAWHKHLAWLQNSLRLFSMRANDVIQIDNYARPAFAIGLGDQVYVDGDNDHGNRVSIFDGNRSQPTFKPNEHFDQMLDIVYRAHFAMPHFDRGLQGVPAALIWDDHELQDGWGTEINSLPGDYKRYFRDALGAFMGYQGLRNPEIYPPYEPRTRSMDVEFDWGKNMRVLMLDTRSIELPAVKDRSSQYEPWRRQLTRVDKWLAAGPKDEPTLFVLGLASPISILSNDSAEKAIDSIIQNTQTVSKLVEQTDDLEDTWARKGYARRVLLDKLADHFLQHRKHRLLIVSGDVHFSGINYLSTGSGSRWAVTAKEAFANESQSKSCATSGVFPRAKDHIVWGWEVISSGITNDAYPATLLNWAMQHGTINGYEDKKPIVSAWPRGSIFGSPSFAEILVDKKENDFNVKVIFYPSVYQTDTRDGGRLINDALGFEKHPQSWALVDYDAVKGSRVTSTSLNSCRVACPAIDAETHRDALTTVPLDWSCIPNTPNTDNPKNCLHACSNVDRLGAAQDQYR